MKSITRPMLGLLTMVSLVILYVACPLIARAGTNGSDLGRALLVQWLLLVPAGFGGPFLVMAWIRGVAFDRFSGVLRRRARLHSIATTASLVGSAAATVVFLTSILVQDSAPVMLMTLNWTMFTLFHTCIMMGLENSSVYHAWRANTAQA